MIGVAAAGVDHQEQMVAGLADDQVVEDAARLVGELRVARAPRRQALDVARHQPLERRRGVGAVQSDLAHVRDVEQGGGGAAMLVLGQDAGRVLDRHLPAGERHHLAAQLAMEIEQRRAPGLAQRAGTSPTHGPAPMARPVLPPLYRT